jgi:hypothetical protein
MSFPNYEQRQSQQATQMVSAYNADDATHGLNMRQNLWKYIGPTALTVVSIRKIDQL